MDDEARLNLKPSNLVMDDFMDSAIGYYEQVMGKISPYFFDESLIKLVAFQQLTVSKKYRITRADARSKKSVDFVKTCVASITTPGDLIGIMRPWRAFDLCLTSPSFVNPTLAANIKKSYCKVGDAYFDCNNCPKSVCRNNMIWNLSTLMYDFDVQDEPLQVAYKHMHEVLGELGMEHAIKLSSLHGLHINVGLPKDCGSTIFDRNVYHYCLLKELHARGVRVDDNSLDPVSIMRAPYSLHYKRLTPSLPVSNEKSLIEAIDHLKQIESLPMKDRVKASLALVKKWDISWLVRNSSLDAFEPLLHRWGQEARTKILRRNKTRTSQRHKTNVGKYLIKGSAMTPEDESEAFQLLQKEGKTDTLARHIIEINKKHEPRTRDEDLDASRDDGEILMKHHGDVPRRIMELRPPVIFLVIDNADMDDMRHITGSHALPLKTNCTKTDEGMPLLFTDPKLMRRYSNRWNCNTTFIGGLYSAYKYVAAADLIIAVKMKHVWDRDMKITEEIERVLQSRDWRRNPGLLAAHLLGLDYCKDNGIEIDGALLTFKRLINSLRNVDATIILTTDHSGADIVPYFELERKKNENEDE